MPKLAAKPRPRSANALLTIVDVAARLNVDKRTIRLAIASRRLRATLIGRQWRFEPEWVEDYIERNSNR